MEAQIGEFLHRPSAEIYWFLEKKSVRRLVNWRVHTGISNLDWYVSTVRPLSTLIWVPNLWIMSEQMSEPGIWLGAEVAQIPQGLHEREAEATGSQATKNQCDKSEADQKQLTQHYLTGLPKGTRPRTEVPS